MYLHRLCMNTLSTRTDAYTPVQRREEDREREREIDTEREREGNKKGAVITVKRWLSRC